MPKNWNRRFKHNRDKMKTGDIFELAEVVRNLSLRDHEKGLSTGEKQMFVKAKKILASELMYAKGDGRERGRHLARRSALGRRRLEEEDHQGRRGRKRLARGRDLQLSVWAVLAAAGRGERLGADRPKAFAPLARPAAPRREPRAARGIGLGRFDRRRRAARLGGAGDPARRGARLRQGRRVGRRRARRVAESVRIGVAEVGDDAAVILVHDAARPLRLGRGDRACASRRSREGWDGAVPGLPVVDTVKRVDGDGRSSRRSTARAASPSRRRRPSSRTCCAPRRSFEGTDCASARRAAGGAGARRRGRPAAVEGDDAGRSRARRELAGRRRVIVDYHMHLRDPDERIGYTVEAVERFVEAAGARAASTRSASPSTSTTSAQTRDFWEPQYQLGALRLRPRRLRRRGARGEAAGPAGQARARGRLRRRRRAAGRARGDPRRRTRGTTCSARCTGSARRRGGRHGARHLGEGVRRRGLARSTSPRSPSSPRRATSTCSPIPTWRRSSVAVPRDGSTIRPLDGRRARDLDRRAATSRSASSTRTSSCSRRIRARSRLPPTRTSPRTSAATSIAHWSYARAAGYDTVTVFEGRRARQEPLG